MRGQRTTSRTAGLCAAACMFALSGNARATVLVPAGLGELAREAGAIVRGRVVAAEPRFTPDRRAIETLVTIETEATLKGSLGATVQFLVPGGTLGRYRSIFVGAPVISAGERLVVFLGWTGPSYPYLLGLSQGLFRVQSDAGNRWLVMPSPIQPAAAGSAVVVRGDPGRRSMPLADFEHRVQAVLTEAR